MTESTAQKLSDVNTQTASLPHLCKVEESLQHPARAQLSSSLHLLSASTPRYCWGIAWQPHHLCRLLQQQLLPCGLYRTVPTTDKHISMCFRPNSSCLNQKGSKSKAEVTNRLTCIQPQTAFLSRSFSHTLLHIHSLSQGDFQQNLAAAWQSLCLCRGAGSPD